MSTANAATDPPPDSLPPSATRSERWFAVLILDLENSQGDLEREFRDTGAPEIREAARCLSEAVRWLAHARKVREDKAQRIADAAKQAIPAPVQPPAPVAPPAPVEQSAEPNTAAAEKFVESRREPEAPDKVKKRG